MKSYVIITAVGPDRPGLVEEISAGLVAREMNIESSRMAVLGGEFALILLAAGESEQVERIVEKPEALVAGTGLSVFAKKTVAPSARALPASLPYSLIVAGMDHPGIVHEVSRVLHEFQVNIESLETRVALAPVSGTPLFTMEALLAVPTTVKIKTLKARLMELADNLNMDLEFEAEETR